MDPVLSAGRASGTVMASVDEGVDEERFIIADVSRDGAWIAMPRTAAADLTRWR